MFARAFIILVMMVVVSKVQATAVLRGVILENQEGGSPMENVAVSAIGGNPTNTGVDGQFTFKFPNKNPGDVTRVSVKKEGYVVVNEVQLDVTLSGHPDEHLVKFLVCKEGDREEWAGLFYRVKSGEAVDETYKKKAENASPAERARLSQERDKVKAAAEKAAERFAKQKPGGGSELYRAAMRLFLDGKVNEALETLSDEKLQQLSEAAKQKGKAEAEKATEDVIQAWLLKAELFTLQFRFEEAEKAYQAAIDVSPDSFKANFAFAGFHAYLDRNDKARRAYARCLELAKSKGNNGDVAETLHNLANFDTDQNQPEAARNEYEEALKIYRELAQENPEMYQGDMTETLNNLANLDQAQNRPEEARKGYEKALRIRRILAQKNPDTYQPRVVDTLENLAILDAAQNRPGAARNGFKETLKIRREIAKKNPEEQFKVAGTLINLGTFYENQKRPEEAGTRYEEALNIFRELAQKNPETYLYQQGVAITLNDLARLDLRQKRPEAARRKFEEVLNIYRELVKRAPDTNQHYLWTVLNNLAFLDLGQNRPEAARKKYEEALNIFRELAKNNSDIYQPRVAVTLKVLAVLDKKQNRPEAARKEFEEALSIYKQLAAGNPARFRSEVAKVERELRTLKY